MELKEIDEYAENALEGYVGVNPEHTKKEAFIHGFKAGYLTASRYERVNIIKELKEMFSNSSICDGVRMLNEMEDELKGGN